VLGSDVYDKLLILQALKKSFPYVVFFTTDLDARLFHPGELAWTRNLVVASHFDLTLNEKLQGTIPPFRDTYQTATFFTLLRVLDVLKDPDSKQRNWPEHKKPMLVFQPDGIQQVLNFELVPQVKLHEIGRNGPVDISVNKYRLNIDQTQSLEPISTVRAASANLDDALMNALKAIACLLVVVVLLISSSTSLSGWVFQSLLSPSSVSTNAIATGLVLCLFLLPLLFGGILYLTSDFYEGEPFSFLDGVSIWPSQSLRGAAAGLALLFGWRLIHCGPGVSYSLKKQFPELRKPRRNPTQSSSTAPWLPEWPKIFIGNWKLDTQVKTLAILWQEYRGRLHWNWLLMRVVPVSVLFFLVGKLVLGVNGLPFTPFRGNVANQVNYILLQLSVLGVIVVIFLVLDITQLTSVFINKLVPKTIGQLTPPLALAPLRLIEQLTDRIDNYIWCPTVLLVLMLMARSEFIDNWDFPIGLMVIIGLSASYVIVSAIQLRQASEIARQRVIDSFSAQPSNTLATDSPDTIRKTIEEIKALSKGAFMPITELPVFRAVTLPTGFYALLTLAETFIKN